MGTLDDTADDFDAPLDSREHVLLRETAWMGSDLIEGGYLLGMLTGTNLFRFPDEEYVRRLKEFITNGVSSRAAEVFFRPPDCQQLILYLRHIYHTETKFPSMPSRNDRREKVFAYFLHNLDASDAEIAAAVGTTEKQIQRMADLKYARRLIHQTRPASRED
jgi:hypothetical protein